MAPITVCVCVCVYISTETHTLAGGKRLGSPGRGSAPRWLARSLPTLFRLALKLSVCKREVCHSTADLSDLSSSIFLSFSLSLPVTRSCAWTEGRFPVPLAWPSVGGRGGRGGEDDGGAWQRAFLVSSLLLCCLLVTFQH